MSGLQIGYYAKLVQRGSMLIDEVPADVKDDVLAFMKTGKVPERKVQEHVMMEPGRIDDKRLGSLVLPEMSTCGISVQDLRDGIPVWMKGKNSVIFNGVEIQPQNVRYELGLVENTTGYFNGMPDVKVNTSDDGFDLCITGTAREGADHGGK